MPPTTTNTVRAVVKMQTSLGSLVSGPASARFEVHHFLSGRRFCFHLAVIKEKLERTERRDISATLKEVESLFPRGGAHTTQWKDGCKTCTVRTTYSFAVRSHVTAASARGNFLRLKAVSGR